MTFDAGTIVVVVTAVVCCNSVYPAPPRNSSVLWCRSSLPPFFCCLFVVETYPQQHVNKIGDVVVNNPMINHIIRLCRSCPSCNVSGQYFSSSIPLKIPTGNFAIKKNIYKAAWRKYKKQQQPQQQQQLLVVSIIYYYKKPDTLLRNTVLYIQVDAT